MYLSDVYTVSCNLAGIPGHEHPVRVHARRACRSGCNCSAPPFDEETLLRVARMYEAATDWHTRRPGE